MMNNLQTPYARESYSEGHLRARDKLLIGPSAALAVYLVGAAFNSDLGFVFDKDYRPVETDSALVEKIASNERKVTLTVSGLSAAVLIGSFYALRRQSR